MAFPGFKKEEDRRDMVRAFSLFCMFSVDLLFTFRSLFSTPRLEERSKRRTKFIFKLDREPEMQTMMKFILKLDREQDMMN